jgi:hypothetical protein
VRRRYEVHDDPDVRIALSKMMKFVPAAKKQ